MQYEGHSKILWNFNFVSHVSIELKILNINDLAKLLVEIFLKIKRSY